MLTLTKCSKANVLDQATNRMLKAHVSLDPSGGILITTPITASLSTGGLVPVSFLDGTLGVVRCLCRLSSPSTSPDRKFSIYRCQIREELSREQRREDLKIPLNILVTVTLSSSGATGSATIRDLSAGGVYLATGLVAQPGEELSFSFRQKNLSLSLTARILRVEAAMDATGRLVRGYGCRFIQLSPFQESQLRSYVFQEDKRQSAAEKD